MQGYMLSSVVMLDGYVLESISDIQLGGHPDIRY